MNKKQACDLIAFCQQWFQEETFPHNPEDIYELYREKNEAKFKNSFVEEHIDEWLQLWPASVKSNGKLIKQSNKLGRLDCIKKMKVLMKETGFTWDNIMAATKEYLEEKESQGWAFTLTCSNFIHHRDKGSELAARVEDLSNQPITESKSYRSEFI